MSPSREHESYAAYMPAVGRMIENRDGLSLSGEV